MLHFEEKYISNLSKSARFILTEIVCIIEPNLYKTGKLFRNGNVDLLHLM